MLEGLCFSVALMRLLGLTDNRHWKLEKPLLSINPANQTITTQGSDLVDYLHLAWRAYNSTRHYRPDAIVANNDGLLGVISVIVGRIFQVPVFIHVGGDCWSGHWEHLVQGFKKRSVSQVLKYTTLIALNRIAFRYVTGCFAVSESVERTILENTRLDEDSVKIVHTPISEDLEQNTERRSWRYREPTLLTVTNLEFKGKYEAIRGTLPIVARFLEDNSAWSYKIAGSGEYLDCLHSYLEQELPEYISSRIKLLGYVEDVDELYRDSSIFFYPSFDDGYPSVVLEAQVFGLPVITNSDQGMLDQVECGYNGLIFDIDQPSYLYEILCFLKSNPDLAEKLGDNGSRFVKENNTIDSIGKEIQTAIKNIST